MVCNSNLQYLVIVTVTVSCAGEKGHNFVLDLCGLHLMRVHQFAAYSDATKILCTVHSSLFPFWNAKLYLLHSCFTSGLLSIIFFRSLLPSRFLCTHWLPRRREPARRGAVELWPLPCWLLLSQLPGARPAALSPLPLLPQWWVHKPYYPCPAGFKIMLFAVRYSLKTGLRLVTSPATDWYWLILIGL